MGIKDKFKFLDGFVEKLKGPFARFKDLSLKDSLPNLKESLSKISLKSLGKGKSSVIPGAKRSKQGKFTSFVEGLQWDELIHKFFSPSSRAKIHRVFLVGLVGTSAYTTGKIIATALHKDIAPQKKSMKAPPGSYSSGSELRSQIDAIRTANLFNAKESGAPSSGPKGKKADANIICKKASKSSSLPIKLIFTTVLQDSVKSIASVQVRSGQEMLNIREGDKIKEMAEIGKIDHQKIIFKNLENRLCEYIENRDKKFSYKPLDILTPKAGKKLMNAQKFKGIKNDGNNYKIKKSIRDDMLKDISNVLTQARAVKIKNPDGSLSFKITEIVPGSIYSKLNISDGDVIDSINGKKIMNVNEIMSLFGKIKQVDSLQIGRRRSGISENLDYQFTD